MKNLDLINPEFAKPRSLCSFGAVLPCLSSLIALTFVNGSTPDVRALDNPVAIFFMVLAALSATLFVLPRLLNWGWSTTYFLILSLELGSVILMFGIPWLCLLLYSAFSLPYRIIIFVAYLFMIFLPTRKIIEIYICVKNDRRLLDYLYENSDGQTYFLQQNDTYLLEKKYKASLFPSAKYLLIFCLLGFCTFPIASTMSQSIGLPYPHIFIGIFATPLNTMAIAFVIRGWFVFYYLPRLVTKDGSTAHVDMTSKTKL